MKLLILAALAVYAVQGKPTSDCPRRDLSFHTTYTQAFRSVNKLDNGSPRFGINSEINDVYEPKETYEFAIGQSEDSDVIKHFYMVTSPVDEASECSVGSWQQLTSEGPQPIEGCEHVLEYRGTDLKLFVWTAPDCGCVTISATVVNERDDFFTDDEDDLQGPLTMTLCAEDEDDDNEAVSTQLDEDFYGIEGNEETDFIEEVNEIITSEVEEEDDDQAEDKLVSEEDEDDEENSEESDEDAKRNRKQRGKGKGKWSRKDGGKEKGRGKGKNRGLYKLGTKDGDANSEDEEEQTSKRGMKNGAGRGKKAFIGHKWAKKMGRKSKAGPKSEAEKTKRLQSVCERISDEVASPPKMWSQKKANLTEAAIEARAKHWVQYRENMLVCCQESQDDELLGCFKEAHGRRIAEKMCTTTDEDYKHGEMPEKLRGAQEKCCATEGDEKKECVMEAFKIMKKTKKSWKSGPVDKKAKIANICKKIEKNAVPRRKMGKLSKAGIVDKTKWTTIFTERRLAMSECCKLVEETDRESCLEDQHEQRLDRVCQGEEPLSPPWKKNTEKTQQAVTEQCCKVEDAERYSCFEEKLPGRHRGRGHHGRKHHHKKGHHHHSEQTEETEDVMEKTAEVNEEKETKRTMHMKKGNRKSTSVSKTMRKQKRMCCQSGRKGGNALELKGSKWQSCQQEAKGYSVEKEGEEQGVCIRSFRKCCMKSAIRNARDEVVEIPQEEEEEEQLTSA